jgi:acetylornithine/succinyldiaminopimelate/putrescine aminotransferase
MMTLAKPLAGGLPIGVILMNGDVTAVIESEDHGNVFGGGPLVFSVRTLTFDHICDEEAMILQVNQA